MCKSSKKKRQYYTHFIRCHEVEIKDALFLQFNMSKMNPIQHLGYKDSPAKHKVLNVKQWTKTDTARSSLLNSSKALNAVCCN